MYLKMMEDLSGRKNEALFWARESTIPMRADPAESAEMINQLVCGDMCHIIEDKGNWVKVQLVTDQYEGWVDRKMLLEFMPQAALKKENPPDFWPLSYQMAISASIQWEDGGIQRLPIGAFIPLINMHGAQWLGYPFTQGKIVEGSTFSPILGQSRGHLVEICEQFMYTPYLWGGCSGFGIDCSGLMQRVFRACGIQIPRDSGAQAKEGETIAWKDRKEGDLIFLKKPNQTRITHVGLLRGDDTIIHASGRVRVDQLTEKGIYHSHHKLSYHLVTIKRC